MRRRMTHQADKVPVFDSTGAICQHIADQLRIDLARTVKSNRRLEVIVADVSVHSCGDRNNTRLIILRLKVLAEVDSISHAMGGSNEDQTSQILISAGLFSLLLL